MAHVAHGLPHFLFFLFLAFGVIAAVRATVETVVRGWVGRRVAREAIGTLLQDLVSRIRTPEVTDVRLRCNVMKLARGGLRVLASAGGAMTEDERATEWLASGQHWQGACGLAVHERKPVVLDLGDWQRRPYQEILHDDRQPRWGLTEEQWNRTASVGSVISVPLVRRERVLGVLNVDAPIDLRSWLPPEREDDLLDRMHSVSGVLALLLEL